MNKSKDNVPQLEKVRALVDFEMGDDHVKEGAVLEVTVPNRQHLVGRSLCERVAPEKNAAAAMPKTVAELTEALDMLEIDVPAGAKKAELLELYQAATSKDPEQDGKD